LKELLEYIAKSLVDDPTEVRVVVKQDRREIRVELKVAEQDMGRIIGRNGRVANAIRALMRAAAARRGERTSLDIL
jgi:predicted RNA-binding protein YlqC (UPF0109 family)